MMLSSLSVLLIVAAWQVIIGKTDPPESETAVAVIMCTLSGFKLSHIHAKLHKIDFVPVNNLAFGYVNKEFDFEPYEPCSNNVQFVDCRSHLSEYPEIVYCVGKLFAKCCVGLVVELRQLVSHDGKRADRETCRHMSRQTGGQRENRQTDRS